MIWLRTTTEKCGVRYEVLNGDPYRPRGTGSGVVLWERLVCFRASRPAGGPEFQAAARAQEEAAERLLDGLRKS